jgi:GH25 family lysozyme M1 (1,4-beta-N-acetylmuramidase)
VTDAIFAGDQSAEEDQAVPLAGDRADGIDVSVWQEGITWSKVAGAGYTFAFVRSSFGDSYVDPNFVDNILEARQAGMHAGAYHAANPMDPEYDPETDPAVDGYQEAMHFVNVAGDYMGEGYLRPVLDLELDRGNISRAEMTLWVHTFMSTVERETGVEPLIYTAPYIMQDEMEASITRYTLWIAHWTCDKTESPNTAYFDDWEFWQYHGPSACGVNDVPGIVDINERGVDLNVYRSDPESLPEAEVRTLDLNFTAQVVDRFAPLEIQMDAEISGTAQQPTDYALWWDCDDPGMFVGDVEGVCGALPQPADGACGENENGLRCLAVTDLTLSHLHTYASFGNYTPKLLVNREGTFSAHEQRAMRVNEPARIGERSDFNGDGVTDVAVYRPGNQTWYVKDQGKTRWGRSGDLPVPGDYDGGGLVDIAVYRPGNGKWYIRDQGSFPWGHEGDIPVPCDYTGDGITNIAVYRPGNGKWYIKGQLPVSWGLEGDVPVPADYDGNGTCDIAVYRPSNGKWYLKDQGAVSWGLTGDIPVPADYDGDRVTDIAVYRASNGSWYILGQEPVKWGSDQDIPAPGDYDGDGAAEVAVLRPGNGKWYLKDLGNYRWYSSEDYPLPVWDTNADGEPH